MKVTPAPGEDIALELYAANARTGLLDNALEVRDRGPRGLTGAQIATAKGLPRSTASASAASAAM